MKYDKNNPLRVFEAFAGYGSQSLALERLKRDFPEFDYKLIGFSEIDPSAITAYKALHGDVENYGDISKIDWGKVPDFDFFTMSSPCQDFSNAGLQRGGEEGSGTRSSLLWECSRAIELKRPKYVFFENVKGLVQQKFIKGFNAWQRRLEGFGYVNFAQVLNASDFNVPQNRERIYMISILITEDEQNPRYFFPKKMPLELCLNDVLEEEVDEKYFLSDEMLARFCEKSIEEDGRSASSENDFDEEDEEDFENFFVAQ